MAKKAVVLLAGGFEEVEAVTPIDYLRRAGLEVCIAAVGAGGAGGAAGGAGGVAGGAGGAGGAAGARILTGSHGIVFRAEAALGELIDQAGGVPRLCQSLDAVLLPGGLPGAANLAASQEAGALITAMFRAGKLVAAICASPALVLAPLGLLAGKRFTCYPGMETELSEGTWSEDRVVVDGNLITSRGAGTAGAFATAVIGALLGEDAGEKVARSVLLD
jgi:4-methyl-5(b-hydroxyethyl)-thiazole monophosphate biosynthesis